MVLVRAVMLAVLLGVAGCPGGCSQEMEHGGQENDAGGGSASDAAGAESPCHDAGPPPDASPYDASPYDASVPDAAPYDGGPLDGGTDPCRFDAGPDGAPS